MRRFSLLACAMLFGSTCAFATSLSNLPADARAAISAAIESKRTPQYLPPVSQFTLTDPNGANGDQFGASAAIEGNTVVVGSPGAGKAYVFTKPQGRWQPLTRAAELTPADLQDAHGFGGSVAIHGNTIVVGANEARFGGGQFQGAAYVFVEPPNGWTNMTETAELGASDGVTYSGFGWTVAISGSSIAVGAPWGTNGNVGPGIVYEFTEPPNGWTNMTETAELTITNGYEQDDLGISLAVSGNTILAATLPAAENPIGAAYVFVEPPTGWIDMTESAVLTASDAQTNDEFGFSVSLSGDTAVVGAVLHDSRGAIYVFTKPPQGWANSTQTARLEPKPTSNISEAGYSVSVDVNTIIAGAPGSGAYHWGAILFFTRPDGGWTDSSNPRLVRTIDFNYGSDSFGNSVGISGESAVAGASWAPTFPPCHGFCQMGPGEAFVFTKH